MVWKWFGNGLEDRLEMVWKWFGNARVGFGNDLEMIWKIVWNRVWNSMRWRSRGYLDSFCIKNNHNGKNQIVV
jgi:hypothetical protein